MNDLFDPSLKHLARAEMYRSWVFPELYPEERQPVLKNWDDDDLIAYCGGDFAKYEHYRQRYVLSV